MRELADKVEKLAESLLVDHHRRMLFIENYAVFVVVNVWRILKAPRFAENIYCSYAVVLACGIIDSARVALALAAKLTLRVACLRSIFCGGDGFRVFLRLGKIYRYIQFAVIGSGLPAHIASYAVAADIVGIAAETVEIISSLFGRLGVISAEFFIDVRRARR